MTLAVVYSNFGGMVVSETRGGVESDYICDTLGSTIGLMNSAGTMTDRWEYWPFGEVVSRTGTSVTPLTFLGVIGYYQDILAKLFYVRARHLRVDLARWLTVDPVWPRAQAYVYAQSDPIAMVDPSGLLCGYNASPIINPFCTCANCKPPQFPPGPPLDRSCCYSQASLASQAVSNMVTGCWTAGAAIIAVAATICGLVVAALPPPFNFVALAVCFVGILYMIISYLGRCSQMNTDLSAEVIAFENTCLFGNQVVGGVTTILQCTNATSGGAGNS